MVTKEEASAATEVKGEGKQDSPAPSAQASAPAESDLEAKVTKLEADLASEREEKARLKDKLAGHEGTAFQRNAWERAIKMSDQTTAELAEVIEALVLSNTDDPEHPARKTLAAYKARTQEERTQAALSATINQDWSAILEAVADAEGRKLESNEDAQEIEAFMKGDPTWRNIYNAVAQANAQGNPDIVRGALFKTWKLTKDVIAKHHKTELDAAKNQAKKDAENIVHDEFIKRGLLKTPNPHAAGAIDMGHVPTETELASSNPFETDKKVKSGEWVIKGW